LKIGQKFIQIWIGRQRFYWKYSTNSWSWYWTPSFLILQYLTYENCHFFGTFTFCYFRPTNVTAYCKTWKMFLGILETRKRITQPVSKCKLLKILLKMTIFRIKLLLRLSAKSVIFSEFFLYVVNIYILEVCIFCL
jgi:hypothetical protein